MPFDSQEDLMLAQAKTNILILEPRLKMTRECIECLERGFKSVEASPKYGLGTLDGLVSAIAQVQLTQLKTALTEIENSLSNSKEIVSRLESPPIIDTSAGAKLFRPR